MRVGIVNDLALACEVLRRAVTAVPGYAVAWVAVNGAEAVRLAHDDPSDVILMDLIMPVMDGVEATRRIISATPCPILLVTSSVHGNFSKVYEAMGHGALDAVDTPTLGPQGALVGGDGLLTRLARLEREQVALRSAASDRAPPTPGPRPPAGRATPALLAVGASTGGPDALARVLAALPATLPVAVVLVQHIGVGFAPSLAQWLQGKTALPVRLAATGEVPRPGVILLAATDDHLVLQPDGRLAYTHEPRENPFRPSVDVFFQSLAQGWPRPGVAVLLTGMGSDGGAGLLRLRQAGWLTLAQDEATSVVYGMPKAAAELGAACLTLPLDRIGPAAVGHLQGARGG